MSYIELVIKIPEELKEALDNAKKENAFNHMRDYNDTIYNALKNAILLPKGHGRIIDESQVEGTFTWDNGFIECFAPTIIEADEVESEEES